MASQQKIQVLAVGDLQTGDRQGGGKWHRKTLQIWTGEVAGNHVFYAEPDVLETLAPGYYMIDVYPRAGARGAIEFTITNISPVGQVKEKQAA